MNNHIRLVYLESDNVDAVVSVLRELQSMPRGFVAPTEPTSPALPARSKVPELPAPPAEPKPAKPSKAEKAPAGAALPRGPKGRVSGVSDLVLDAFRADAEPDRKALARQAYGDDSAENVKRIQRTVWKLCSNGELKALATGGYKVKS